MQGSVISLGNPIVEDLLVSGVERFQTYRVKSARSYCSFCPFRIVNLGSIESSCSSCSINLAGTLCMPAFAGKLRTGL